LSSKLEAVSPARREIPESYMWLGFIELGSRVGPLRRVDHERWRYPEIEVFVLVLIVVAVVEIAFPELVVAEQMRIILGGFVRSVEEAVAVPSFVTAAREVFALPPILLDIAVVVVEQIDVVARESAVGAG